MSGEQIEVGQCANCGIVAGNEVEFRFPRPGKCGKCGAELESETIADREEVAEYA